MCHFICNHSYFGNIVLVCIMVSSAMLAAEDPLKSDSPRNKVSKFLVHFRTFQDRRKLLKVGGHNINMIFAFTLLCSLTMPANIWGGSVTISLPPLFRQSSS